MNSISILKWMGTWDWGNVADWVSGIGSIGAILAVYWQSKQDTKRLEKQIKRDDELQSSRKKAEEKQKYSETLLHLKKILGFIEIIKSDMEGKRRYPKTISNNFNFINAEFSRCAKWIEDEIAEIDVNIVDRSLLQELNKEIVFRIYVMMLHIDNDDIEEALYCLALIDHNTVKLTDGCPGDGTLKFEYSKKYSECKNPKHGKNNRRLQKEIEKIEKLISA